MRTSISIVLLLVCSSLLLEVGFGRSNPKYGVDPVAHPKSVSRFGFYFGGGGLLFPPSVPTPTFPRPTPAAPKQQQPKVGPPPTPTPAAPKQQQPRVRPPPTPIPAAPKQQEPRMRPPPTPTPAAPRQQPRRPRVQTPYEGIRRCWSSLNTVQSCVLDILGGFLFADFSHVGQECCAAVVEIDEYCYGQMFNQFNNNYYAPELRQNCAQRYPPRVPHRG